MTVEHKKWMSGIDLKENHLSLSTAINSSSHRGTFMPRLIDSSFPWLHLFLDFFVRLLCDNFSWFLSWKLFIFISSLRTSYSEFLTYSPHPPTSPRSSVLFLTHPSLRMPILLLNHQAQFWCPWLYEYGACGTHPWQHSERKQSLLQQLSITTGSLIGLELQVHLQLPCWYFFWLELAPGFCMLP